MCINILYWYFSFWLTLLYIIGSSFIHLVSTDSNGLGAASGKIVIIHLFSNCLLKNYGQDSKRNTDVKSRLLDSAGEGKGGKIWENSIEICMYSMWNRSPAQVPCMRQGAPGWCTGMTLRDGMGREVGERFRMGNTCTPMIHVNVWQKPPQYCKVISLQLK